MKRIPLGRTGLEVSQLCLGSMTWGSQNTEAEGHAQLDMGIGAGINFVDTAEMYPTNPVRAETVGRTEEIIGSWLKKTGKREDLVIATKITGEGQKMVRDGAPITGKLMEAAVEASLTRLGTDVIDIYQLHWPNRGSYHFRKSWHFDPSGQSRDETVAHMLDMLETADRLIAAGKIRHFALSNESAWGTALWLRLAEENGLPRVASVQNEYSLLCRIYDTDMAELGVNEDMPLLAFSPLAAGLLSGKYAGDVTPEGSRRSFTPQLGGRITPRVFEAVAAYMGIATRHGLDPCQMALAWCLTRPFPIVPIIGATSTAQLQIALGSVELTLPAEVMEEIDAAHRAHPMPY
ncbi:aldo/keto reductase [Acidimangrovimonas pyrenivorans]|uniref:Aldo/keto reductase n=1 Tax=Acidimangrovimonas pyrenivorans TaxID=2030798 RepID=A0ABV7AKS0_9RHOB